MDAERRIGWSPALAIFALSVAALLCWSAAAQAAPPGNDDFADAVPLGPGAPTGAMGTNVEATKEAGEPGHAGDIGGHSVWYSYTSFGNGMVGVKVPPGCFGGLEPLVSVYTGSAVNALTPIASNEGPGGGCFFTEAPVAEFEANAGTTYWIAVDGRGGSEGPFEIQVNPPPGNDDFAAATTIPAVPPESISGSNRMADKQAGEPNHAGDLGGRSVWYQWTPATSGIVDISTCSSFNSLDSLLAVYTGSAVDSLTPVAANDDGPQDNGFAGCSWTNSKLSVEVEAGTTYWIAVDGSGGSVGSFTLRINGRPQNDDFASPKVLSASLPAWSSQETNRLATKESGEPNHAGDPGGRSVWYSWTPSSSGPVAIATCTPQSDLDTTLAVYTGSSLGGLSAVAASDDGTNLGCDGSASEVRFDAVAGTTYRIAVDGKESEGDFSLSLEAPPANDDFADAKPVGPTLPVSTSGSTRFASKEAGEPDHAGDATDNSVWFTWTPDESGPVVISTCPYGGNTPDTVLAVYTGSAVGALTPVAADDDSSSACSELASEVRLNAVAGTTYRIAVASKGGSQGIFSLDIGGRPANDAFAAAEVLPPNANSAWASTVFASKEAGEPDHAGDAGGHSIWFSWTPDRSGPVEISACGRNGADPLLAVYTGSAVNALTEVAANDDRVEKSMDEMCGSLQDSAVTLDVVAGTAYSIAVDTKGGEGRVALNFIPAPQNDDFAHAQELTDTVPLFGAQNLKLASKEAGEPSHAGDPGGHSVWYSWTPPKTMTVTVRICTHAGSIDSLLAIYTGSAVDDLTLVAADDDGSVVKECHETDGELELTVQAGTTYFIALDGREVDSNSLQLIVEGGARNDDFADTQPLGGSSRVEWFSSNRGTSKETGEPDHAGEAGGASVWFKWTAPRSGTFSIDTCDSGFDTLLAVYTGAAVDGLTPVQSNDDGSGKCGPQSKLSFEAVANTVYRIAVDGKGGEKGPLWLHIVPAPGNDDFAEAEAIPGTLGWYWPGSTLLATKESGEPDHGGAGGTHSVWYSWTPKKAALVEVDLCTRTFDPALAVYTGSAVGGLTPVATADAGTGECDEGRSVSFNAAAGTTYRFAVDGVSGDSGNFFLHVRGAGTLSVAKSGTGSGTVSSSPAGLSCGPDCAEIFATGTRVTLMAAPAGGSIFAGWSGGGCSGTGPCQLNLGGDTQITATFVSAPGGGYGGSVTPPPSVPPPATTPPPPKKPIKCKRGFRKKIVHGKRRCVKKPKKHRRHHG